MIFAPGFSTAETISEVSGRGVGMDAVRKAIADLRGQITVQSTWGIGTVFAIQLPHTLSLGLLAVAEETQFFIPLPSVVRCFIVPTEKLITAPNHLIDLEGEMAPIHWLTSAFGQSSQKLQPSSNIILLRNNEDKKLALIVDKIIGQYQAILQPIPKQLAHIELISGVTVLSNGAVGLALDVFQLFERQKTKSAVKPPVSSLT